MHARQSVGYWSGVKDEQIGSWNITLLGGIRDSVSKYVGITYDDSSPTGLDGMIELPSCVAWIRPTEIGTAADDAQDNDWVVDIVERVKQYSLALLDSSLPEACNELSNQDFGFCRRYGDRGIISINEYLCNRQGFRHDGKQSRESLTGVS